MTLTKNEQKFYDRGVLVGRDAEKERIRKSLSNARGAFGWPPQYDDIIDIIDGKDY